MPTPTSNYAAALRRFFKATGLNAAELAELAGLEPSVVFDAVDGHRLPRASDRGLIAEQITLIQRERA